ncbi:MAG: hypothetical protein ACTSU2_06945 [Promethearchaeota archaeon]
MNGPDQDLEEEETLEEETTAASEEVLIDASKEEVGEGSQNLLEKGVLEKELEGADLWEITGFQRVLGGYWHNYIFNIFILLFGIVVVSVIYSIILPYPEAIGFKSVVSSLFALMFTVFDVGVGSSVNRFVSEYAGRGEMEKTIEYIRFFIWFQMITGLFQITIIAFWALEIAININNFAPLVWFFLINSCVQFPGMLGVFKSCLEAFQRFNKSNIVNFVDTVALESTTQIVFILLGRYFGGRNPMYGELMGATMGYILGLYIDDFIAMLIAAKFFSTILKKYNIKLSLLIIPKVSKEVIKESLIFGLKSMFQGLFYQISMLFMSFIQILWLPNYATIIGLMTVADTIARIIIQDFPIKSAISEAYNSGKYNLTDYYIQSQFKWYGILTFYLTLEVGMLIPGTIAIIAPNYAGASWMIGYLLISRFFIPTIHFSDSVQVSCNKPEYAAYSLFVQMAVRLVSFTLLIYPKFIPSLFENYNYAIAYLMADLPAILAKNIFAWRIIDKKIIKIKVNIWQTIISPFLAILPLIPINLILKSIFNLYASNSGMALIFAMFFIVFLLFIAPAFILMPSLGFFAGWDDRGLEHLKNAAEMAGPSKLFVKTMYKMANIGYQKTPFKFLRDKIIIPHELADKEASELIQIRNQNLAKLSNSYI